MTILGLAGSSQNDERFEMNVYLASLGNMGPNNDLVGIN